MPETNIPLDAIEAGEKLMRQNRRPVPGSWDDLNQQMTGDDYLAEIEGPDGEKTFTSYVVTPEMYKKFNLANDPRFGGRPGAVPGASPIAQPDVEAMPGYGSLGELPPARMPIPSPEEAKQAAYRMGDMFVAMYEDSPEIAHWLMNNPQMMFTMPEIASVVGEFYGDYGVAEGVVDYLMTDGELGGLVDYGHWSEAYEKQAATAQFFADYGARFKREELDILATVWSSVSHEGQERLAGLAWRWLNPGDQERDLGDNATRAEFIQFIYEEGAGEQQHELASETFLGRVGEIFDIPRNVIYGSLNEAMAWAATLGNPEEHVYRSGLTFGQQIAVSSGLNPDDENWGNYSGFWDGLSASFGDPTNLLFGLGVASKLSKTAAAAAEVVGTWGKVRQAFRASVPVLGRKHAVVPVAGRAPSVRFFHTLLGKTSDELVQLAAKNGVFDDIHNLIQTRGLAAVVEKYPELEQIADGLGGLLKRAKDPQEIQDIFQEARSLAFLSNDGAGFTRITSDLAGAEARRAAALKAGVQDGTIGLQDLTIGLDRVNHTRTGVWAGEVGEGRVLRQTALNGDGESKVVLAGAKVTRQNVDEGFLQSFVNWAARLNRAAHGDTTVLTAAQTRRLGRATRAVGRGNEDITDLGSRFTMLADQGGGRAIKHGDEVFYYQEAPHIDGVAYILRDGDGNVVAGTQALDAKPGGYTWTAEGRRGERLQDVLHDAIRDKRGDRWLADIINKRATDPNITAAGAKNLSRQASRMLDTPSPNVAVTDSMVAKVLDGRIQDLDDAEMTLFMRYANSTNADIIDFGNFQGGVLTRRGADRAITGVDRVADGASKGRMAGMDQEIMELRTIAQKMRAGERQTWVVVDLPAKVPSPRKLTGRPWRKFATNDSKTWWGQFRRTTAAKVFKQAPERTISLTNGSEGGRSLRNFLAQVGADRPFITDALNEYYAASRADRYDVLSDIMIRAGEHTGHPILEHALEQMTSKGGVFSFGKIGGSEVAVGASRTRGVAKDSALPYMPSQRTSNFELPGPEFMQMLRRFKRAKSWNAVVPSGKNRGLVRGISRATAEKREKVLDLYKAQLRAQNVDPGTFGDSDLLALAYSKVTGDTNSIGRLQQLASKYNAFKWGHNYFTRMQLAIRPITWAWRVAFLEEGIRAQFFDLPSMYRNPVRYMQYFYDGAVTTRATAWRTKQLSAIGGMIDQILPRGAKMNATQLDGLRNSLPEFGRYLDAKELAPTSAVEVRAALANFMEAGMDDMHMLRGFEDAGYAVKRAMKIRTRKLTEAKNVLRRSNLPVDFDWGDIDDIANQGLMALMETQLGGGTHLLQYRIGEMTEDGMHHYGTAWGTQAIRHIEDPIVGRYGLGRIEARANGLADGSFNGAALVHDPNWSDMKPIVQRIARHNKWGDDLTDVELADEYLTRIIDPITDHILRPILGDDVVEAGERARQLRTGKRTILSNGEEFAITGADHGTAQATLRKLAADAERAGNDINLPAEVAGMMDARMFFDDNANVMAQGWQRLTSKILEYAGEKTTQQLNRRPGWLAAYRDQYDYLTGVLKFDDDLARTVASEKASEMVNYVFYNLNNGTPFLKSMNRHIPFFGAMWEVTQTWFYKIPFAHGTMLGTPMMVRKIDRTFQALENLGLIRHEDMMDADGNVEESVLYLTFEEDPDLGNELGNLISKAGHTMLGLPRTLVTQLANLRNLMTDHEIDFDDEGAFKDSINYMIGSPVKLYGDQSHGIMAVNQIYLGMDPLKSGIASWALNKSGLIGDMRLENAVAGENIQEMADRMAVDQGMLIRANAGPLREKLGMDGYAQLLRGHIKVEDVILNEGESLAIPGSSWMDTFLEDIVFPFGVEETVAGKLYELTPSWSHYALRGLGLWESGGDPSNWTTLNEDGTVSMPDGENGLLGILLPESSRMQVVGELNKQLLHLEANEQLISKWGEAVKELERMTREAETAGLRIIGEGEVREVANDAVDPEKAEEWRLQFQLVGEMNAHILKRATDNAGAALLFRGIGGFMSPGNPRTLFEEEKLASEYWSVATAELEQLRGGRFELPAKFEDFQMRQELVRQFLEDESGDQAKAWFMEHYPEIQTFTNPTTFWGPGGKPRELAGIEEYFEDVEAGRRSPLAPSVLMQKLVRSDTFTEREVAIVSRFGNDPWTAAADITYNWNDYKAILEEAKVKFSALEYWDEVHDDGDYANWKDRNREDTLTLAEEMSRRADKIADSIAYLEALSPSQDMDPDERRTYVRALRDAARGFRDFIGNWNEEMEGTFLDSPREKALNWYFDTVQSPYYDKLADMYDSLDTIDDTEQRSRVYESIRLFQAEEFGRSYFGEGGVEFPNALEFSWMKKTPQEQEDQRLRWMGLKPEWLGLDATHHLIEGAPALKTYLPSTPEQFALYQEYNDTLIDLREAVDPDPVTGERWLTDSQYTKAKDELDRRFEAVLRAEGRYGEIEFLEMWPIERLALAGLLPASLQPFVPNVRAVREHLTALDKGPSSDVGEQYMDRIWFALLQAIEQDESVRDDVNRLGGHMFDKQSVEAVFPALFYGAYSG